MPLLPLRPFLRLLATLFSRGGEPVQDGSALLYPIRPGTRLFLFGGLCFSAWVLWRNLPLLLHHDLAAVHWGYLAVGIFVGTIAVAMLPRTVRLDEVGLHMEHPFFKTTSIPWAMMEHVEVYQSTSSGRGTCFIRSSDGRTSITLAEMAYHVGDLLEQIHRRTPLPSEPYRRRHWYGG